MSSATYFTIALFILPVMTIIMTILFFRSTESNWRNSRPSLGHSAIGTFFGAMAALMWPLAIAFFVLTYVSHGITSGEWKISISPNKGK